MAAPALSSLPPPPPQPTASGSRATSSNIRLTRRRLAAPALADDHAHASPGWQLRVGLRSLGDDAALHAGARERVGHTAKAAVRSYERMPRARERAPDHVR